MDSPLLMPYSTVFGTRTPFRLLDNEGTVVCLPFQLNIPFCRMVARDASLTRLKRWTIAPIYRISPGGGVSHFSLLSFRFRVEERELILRFLVATESDIERGVRYCLRCRFTRYYR